MLSDPNVKKILPKVGNRYEAALAIAKRARDIENRRVIEGDTEIKDAVDIAAQEIVDEKIYVNIKDRYTVKPDFKGMEIHKKNDKDDNE